MSMKDTISALIGKKNYLKLEYFKKKLLPTKYDEQQNNFVREQLEFYSSIISPGNLCIDVGGNIGLKTEVFLKLGARVVTLEPQQHCLEILEAKFGKKAIILGKGAGAANEIKEFYVSNNAALSSFTKGWVDQFKDSRFAGSEIQAVEKVEIVTLDSLIKTYGTPDFIKIDVEGYELEVLKGLNLPFQCLSFEYAVPEKLDDVTNALENLAAKYPDAFCNYAICNESKFAMGSWKPIREMQEFVKADVFNSSFAGDIYVKSKTV